MLNSALPLLSRYCYCVAS